VPKIATATCYLRHYPRAGKKWAEFADGPLGWDVGLNTTMFHHHGLLLDYACAYRKAARQLFQAFRQTEDSRDMDMHPIIFLYRHALEVYLKAILDLGNPLLLIKGRHMKKGRDIFSGHHLKNLLPGVRDVFEVLDCSGVWVSPNFNSFNDVERVIKAFDEIQHDAFRYPVDKTGSRELLEDALSFNAFTFSDTAEALMELLQNAAIRADDTFQNYCHHIPS
jgi:hypothetical protein